MHHSQSVVSVKAVRIKWYRITKRGIIRWDEQPGNHTFRLLSKHSVSPCL